MESRILRIGSVGTSAVMETMQEAMRLTPGVECAVVYSRDEERAREYARKKGVKESCSDFEELLSMPGLDAIYLASPNSLHSAQTIAALEHGKHVIVEKPAATTEKEVLAMRDAARANGVFFFEAITTIFMPNLIALKELMPRLGKVRSAQIKYGQYSSRYEAFLRGEKPSVFDPAMQGGALNDLGIYCIHTALELLGMPDSISRELEAASNGVDISDTMQLDYPGFKCGIEASKVKDIGSGCHIEFQNGRIDQDGPMNAFDNCRAILNGQTIDLSVQDGGNRMRYELARFRDAIFDRDKDFFESMAIRSAQAASLLEQAAMLV